MHAVGSPSRLRDQRLLHPSWLTIFKQRMFLSLQPRPYGILEERLAGSRRSIDCRSLLSQSSETQLVCHVPRQELIATVDRVIRDVGKHMVRVGFRIQGIELGRTNQAVDATLPHHEIVNLSFAGSARQREPSQAEVIWKLHDQHRTRPARC
jgi:hypothetical protein